MIAALIPAAGLSRRMGRPKLSLPIGGVPLLARVIHAFHAGGVARVVVITAPPTAPGAAAIADLVEAVGAECVIASRPPADMRASVELGLAHLATSDPPTSILLSPGDCPGTRPNLVARLIEEGASHPARIIVPRHGARTGHPILIPWSLAARIPGLPPGVGVNHLLACHPDRVHHLAADPTVLVDLDTPEDWQAWIANHPSG